MPKKSTNKKTEKPKSSEPPSVPDNFVNLIVDFTRDLSITFPEFVPLWEKWTTLELPQEEQRHLFDYCLTVYPQRFFDILYQNEDIFKANSDINVHFLPGVDFKTLYNCENVSENTRKAIWKYLQIILLASVNSVKDKADFGDTMNLFDGIDAEDLQNKLSETFSSISDFFKSSNLEETEDETNEEIPSFSDFEKTFDFEKMSGSMPNAEDLNSHLKNLFNGKIGSLAKEMAEEIAHDLENVLGDQSDTQNPNDVFKTMLKNPKKLIDLIKTVGSKLNAKMQSGEISKDELMKEAAEWVSKMKEMGGDSDQFSELFKNLTKNMGGMGKNMKIDKNALDRFTKAQSTKERLRSKLEKKKQAAELVRQQAMEQAIKNSENVVIEQTAPNNYSFRVEGEGVQEKSSIKSVKAEVDAIMEQMGLENEVVESPKKTKKSKVKK